MRGNLTDREDTGLINSSPVVNVPPLIRLQYGCNRIIKIPGKTTFCTVTIVMILFHSVCITHAEALI